MPALSASISLCFKGNTKRLRENKRRIMAPNKKEMVSENTEQMAKRQEPKEERNERFLPIFFWTD